MRLCLGGASRRRSICGDASAATGWATFRRRRHLHGDACSATLPLRRFRCNASATATHPGPRRRFRGDASAATPPTLLTAEGAPRPARRRDLCPVPRAPCPKRRCGGRAPRDPRPATHAPRAPCPARRLAPRPARPATRATLRSAPAPRAPSDAAPRAPNPPILRPRLRGDTSRANVMPQRRSSQNRLVAAMLPFNRC